MLPDPSSICDRLREVRVRHYGARGRSKLCRELGITPSTYSLYEVSRVPPVDLLVRVAQLTGVSMEWILTGAGEAEPSAPPEATSPRTAKPSVATPQVAAHWIPIIGSTAAGTARYWEEMPVTHGGPEADARLEWKLADYASRPGATSSTPGDLSSTSDLSRSVSLVQISTPDDHGFIEFLSAPSVKEKYPRCVAWRIDGDSMSPRYLDGDLVITSVDHLATAGHPCVARQKGQIGVNCKIYQEVGRDIVLIPINERSQTQRFPANQLVWAHRVLCSVRISQRRDP